MKNKKQILVGKKIGMTQVLLDTGEAVPVTVIKAYENAIIRLRTIDKDGYNAVCVGYGFSKKSRLTKPHKGQFKSGEIYRNIKEFRVGSLDGFELNSKVDTSSFEVNLKYNLQSKTIGRGFTGAIKAWNHQRGPMSHGSKNHRLLGSIGQATTPGRVMKGKKMHTRYGNETVTIKNLTLIKIDGDHLFFKGAVPGKNNTVFVSGVN
ncbi:MAG: 50S ribosomal protein L3 [Candidatus Marinamargulisbacteria bacterium]